MATCSRCGETGESCGKDTQKKTVSTDWEYIYWSLRKTYPSEARFSYSRFGWQPICIIEQALQISYRLDLEWFSNYATPIAILGRSYLSPKGSNAKWFCNPFAKILAITEAKQQFPEKAAREIKALIKDGQIPPVVFEFMDHEVVDLAAQ